MFESRPLAQVIDFHSSALHQIPRLVVLNQKRLLLQSIVEMIPNSLGHKGSSKEISSEIQTELKKLPLPEKVKMIAIYKLYKEIKKIDALKDQEIKAAEKKNLKEEGPIIEAQNAIINGDREIKLEEVKNPEKFLTEQEMKKIGENLGAHRIPQYWLKAFKNTDVLKEQIKPNDEEALKYVRDIKVIDEEGNDNFEIVFHFDENPFFIDNELKKKFFMKDDFPYKTMGTIINWREGKDLTKKEVKKKQKNKKTGQNRVINKVVDAESFFNFFGSTELPEGKDPLQYDQNEENLYEKINTDFELGGAIIDQCVPYSLEYYLGVKAEGDDQDDQDDDGDDDDLDDDDDEPKKSSKQKKPKKGKGDASADVEKPECKQQ